MGSRGGGADSRMLRDLRFHDLHHEATSRLFECGLNPMQVVAITGHKTPQMRQFQKPVDRAALAQWATLGVGTAGRESSGVIGVGAYLRAEDLVKSLG